MYNRKSGQYQLSQMLLKLFEKKKNPLSLFKMAKKKKKKKKKL